jgi:hypothetical protein
LSLPLSLSLSLPSPKKSGKKIFVQVLEDDYLLVPFLPIFKFQLINMRELLGHYFGRY